MDDFLLMEEMVGIFINPGEKFKDYMYSKNDKKILRMLAEQEANIASKSIHKEKVKMWKALNDLGEVRPMIWINEIPWHEMNINNELNLKTSNEFTQTIETKLGRTIYRWKYMQVDMIVEPTILCYLEIENAGFGMSESVNIARTDQRSDIFSREFKPQIDSEKNIEKTKKTKDCVSKE